LLYFSRNAQADFLSWVDSGAVTVEPITTNDFQRIRELIWTLLMLAWYF